MYCLVQFFEQDRDGYPVVIRKSHITPNTSKALCGTRVGKYRCTHADKELKEWLIQKTTCKRCVKLANKRKDL